MDKSFVTFYLGLPSCHRFKRGEIEKKLIRDAFDSGPFTIMTYLPNDVLYRKKEAFSDGVSAETRSWYKIIEEHLDKNNLVKNYDPDSELSKEQQYYKQIFDEYYPNKRSVIPVSYTHLTLPTNREV